MSATPRKRACNNCIQFRSRFSVGRTKVSDRMTTLLLTTEVATFGHDATEFTTFGHDATEFTTFGHDATEFTTFGHDATEFTTSRRGNVSNFALR